MGHERQFVAVPAAESLCVCRYRFKRPKDEILEGRCGWSTVDDGYVGEQSSHRRKSMSCEDLVRSEGALTDSLRQLPLYVMCQRV